jgi:hypothetical protein
MITRLVASVAVTLPVVLAGPVAAEPQAVIYPRLTCNDWSAHAGEPISIAAVRMGVRAVRALALGGVEMRDTEASVSGFPGLTDAQIEAMLQQRCRAHPAEDLPDAVNSVYLDLGFATVVPPPR